MNKDTKKKQELWSKLQADVDRILNDVGHIFDDIAEYTQESDPINIIDIDKVLQMEIPKKYIYRSSNQHTTETSRRMPLYAKHAEQRRIENAPAKKIIRAMPRELQEEVRVYEQIVGTRKTPVIKSAANIFFRRLEY